MKNAIITVVLALAVSAGVGFAVVDYVKQAPDTQPKAGNAVTTLPYTCYGGLCTWRVVGTCNAATSTLFDVANPWGATSTVALDFINGQGQATTTLFSVGTTTLTGGGLALANISPTLVNGGSAATTSYFAAIAGQTTNLGTSQVSAGTNTIGKIIVGGSEYIGAYGTSTATGAGAANYSPGVNCTYGLSYTRAF